LIIPDAIAEKCISLKDQFFDLRGLSVYSSLPVPTLRDYIKGRALPCFKVKGKILVRKSEFDRWLEGYRMNKNKDVDDIVNDVMKSMKSN
jgi:hypothetical protein